jgi:hypothetical protein
MVRNGTIALGSFCQIIKNGTHLIGELVEALEQLLFSDLFVVFCVAKRAKY